MTVTNVLSCYGHVSVKKPDYCSLNNLFAHLLKLLMFTKNKLKRKHGHREKVGSVSKVQKKMDNFFPKEF